MSASIFVGCFEYSDADTEEEGHFEIVVEATDALAAAAKCRERLNALADTSDALGPVNVFIHALVRLPSEGIRGGIFVNMHRFPGDGGISFYDALPFQNRETGEVLFADDVAVGRDKPPAAERTVPEEEEQQQPHYEPVFWSDVERFRKKWKLFWCETDDHDEDWFVVARSPEEAAQFHEDAEGYDEDDATAKFVCALPASEQDQYDAAYWPTDRSLLACGAEFLPYAPQDEHAELRGQAGQGGRVVRIKGNVYGEGDIVSNVVHRLGLDPAS